MVTNLTLAQIAELTETQAREHVERVRWPNGPECPDCGKGTRVLRIQGKSARAGLLQCKGCRRQFTCTVGTIFEGSHIPLKKWLMAINLMCGAKKGISAKQLQRNLGITYKCAWHLSHRIRFAMLQEPVKGMLRGAVEVDETYVGGKPRRRGNNKRGRGTKKIPVLALIERSGRVRTKVIADVKGITLKGAIREHVSKDSTILTDEFLSYRGIGQEYVGGHKFVRHGVGEYVNGNIHTNTAESYFSLLKRGMIGAFHHVSKQHLHRYCNEFDFRWDHRGLTDGEKAIKVIQFAEGRRLMYKEPVAKEIS